MFLGIDERDPVAFAGCDWEVELGYTARIYMSTPSGISGVQLLPTESQFIDRSRYKMDRMKCRV